MLINFHNIEFFSAVNVTLDNTIPSMVILVILSVNVSNQLILIRTKLLWLCVESMHYSIIFGFFCPLIHFNWNICLLFCVTPTAPSMVHLIMTRQRKVPFYNNTQNKICWGGMNKHFDGKIIPMNSTFASISTLFKTLVR